MALHRVHLHDVIHVLAVAWRRARVRQARCLARLHVAGAFRDAFARIELDAVQTRATRDVAESLAKTSSETEQKSR